MKDCFSASNKLTLQHLYLGSEANRFRSQQYQVYGSHKCKTFWRWNISADLL